MSQSVVFLFHSFLHPTVKPQEFFVADWILGFLGRIQEWGGGGGNCIFTFSRNFPCRHWGNNNLYLSKGCHTVTVPPPYPVCHIWKYECFHGFGLEPKTLLTDARLLYTFTGFIAYTFLILGIPLQDCSLAIVIILNKYISIYI